MRWLVEPALLVAFVSGVLPTLVLVADKVDLSVLPDPGEVVSAGAPPVERNADVAAPSLADCLEGQLRYRHPETMEQGEDETFTVLMGGPAASPIPDSAVPGRGPLVEEQTRVCRTMRAELTGPSFGIEPPAKDVNVLLVPVDGLGEWEWQVTPKKTGPQELRLRVYGQLEGDGDYVWLETYEQTIDVSVGLTYTAKALLKDWFQPLGLTVAGLIAAAVAVYSYFRRRARKLVKQEQQKPPVEPVETAQGRDGYL